MTIQEFNEIYFSEVMLFSNEVWEWTENEPEADPNAIVYVTEPSEAAKQIIIDEHLEKQHCIVEFVEAETPGKIGVKFLYFENPMSIC